MPETAAHSLAIGAPGDGYLVIDAVHKRGGTAAFASDPEIFAGIDLLAATEGLLTEPAGGTTIAVLEKLAAAGRFAADDTVVALITGNGLKTLDEHPPKAWPAKIDCELDAMRAALDDLKAAPTLMQTAHERCSSKRPTQPRRSSRPTAAIISSVRCSRSPSSPPSTQTRAWSSSRPSATLSSAASIAAICVSTSMQ